MSPDVDERIRATVDLLTRSPVPAPSLERIGTKKRRVRLARRLEVAALVVAVVVGTAAGTYGLTKVFHGPGSRQQPAAPSSLPANGKIAFLSNRDVGPGNSLIYSINPDGSGSTRLTSDVMTGSTLAWSPNGQTLAFAHALSQEESAIELVDDDGTGRRLLAKLPPVYEIAWSPDGSKIAYSAGSAQIFVMGSGGTGITQLTDPPSLCGDEAPSWSPDGTRIAFRRFCTEQNLGIYVIDADGSGLTRLASNRVRDSGPAWSPDGTKILFGSAGQILSMNADGTGRTTLTSEGENYLPAWSPDGTKIAFTSDRDDNREIYVMNPDGSGQTNVTNDPADDFAPSWQPVPASSGSPAPAASPSASGYVSSKYCLDRQSTANGDLDGDGTTDKANIGPSSCVQQRAPIETPWALSVTYDDGGGVWAMPECGKDVCQALGAGDLNGDGIDELAVIVEQGASTQFLEFFEVPLGPEGLKPVEMAEPGLEGSPAGQPARLPFGGSLTHFAALGCGENDVILEIATLNADQTEWAVHVTNLHLETTAASPRFTVVSTDDSTQPFDPDVGVGDIFEPGAPCWMESGQP
jgi:Tol biopolymer transport system component